MRALILTALVVLAPPAAAQEARYQLERTGDGYARIDTATGEVTSCTEAGSQLVCRMAADERSALEEEIAALEARVEALEAGIGPRGADRLPSDAEVDRAIGLMERFMRGFVGVVRELDEPPA